MLSNQDAEQPVHQLSSRVIKPVDMTEMLGLQSTAHLRHNGVRDMVRKNSNYI